MSNTSAISTIYNYEIASAFLRDSWEKRKRANSRFSLRGWSKQLGFANNAPLSLMLQGKRPVPKKYVPAFIRTLKLSSDEGLYLEVLISHEWSKNQTEKDYFAERLEFLRPKKGIEFQYIDSFNFLKNPLHAILLEMSDLKNFHADPKWIRTQLRSDYSLVEIEDAIERLIRLGYFKREEASLKKVSGHLTTNPDVESEGARVFHREAMAKAAEQMPLQNIDLREFNSYAINIERSKIPKAKQLIREFIGEFAKVIEAEAGAGDETYQLSLQLFSNTKPLPPFED